MNLREVDYQHLLVYDFMQSGNQACPSNPFIPHRTIRELRARLILEEAIETAEALGFRVYFGDDEIFLKDSFEPNMVKIVDGCSDLKVVTVGTEIACGINGKPAFIEVMRSNMTKDFSGAKRPDGKILKGHTYEPPNIEKVLQLQGWKP